MTKEKRKSLSGLRCVATLQTLSRNAKPRERHQIANRFARLENERARLEHEIGIWEGRLQATTKKLATVRDEIDSLRPLLDEAPARNAACRTGRRRARGAAPTDTEERHPAPNRTMQLGY